MKRGVGANKGKDIAHHSNHEGQSLRWPGTVVDESRKDFLGISMRAQSDEGNQDGKETQNVKDQDETLKLGQRRAGKSVDEHGKDEDGPEQQRSLP